MADSIALQSRLDPRSRAARTSIWTISILGLYAALFGLILIAVTLLNVNEFAMHAADFVLIFLGAVAARQLADLFPLILMQAVCIFAVIWDLILAILRFTRGFNCLIDSTTCPPPPDSMYTYLFAGALAIAFFLFALFDYVSLLTLIKIDREYSDAAKQRA